MRKGNQTIFLLGMTGLGLAVAMFVDGMKTTTQAQAHPAKKQAPAPERSPQAASSDQAPSLEAEAERPEPFDEAQHKEAQSTGAEVLSTPGDDGENTDTDTGAEGDDVKDYRSLYLQEKEKNEIMDALANFQDYTYKGDGSKFSKRLYFMREAYRRSREATPVDATAFLAAINQEPLMQELVAKGYDKQLFQEAKKRRRREATLKKQRKKKKEVEA